MTSLNSEIDAFLRRHSMSEWSFGESALNDRHLVRQLREGRELRRATEERVRAFIRNYRPAEQANAA